IKRVSAKFVPCLLTADQRHSRVNACQRLKEHLEIDSDFFSKVITGDESCCYEHDPETKRQSSQWKSSSSPRPKKASQAGCQVKCQDDTDLLF
ncbi:unnamed protein product, partial [Ixodes hexagonus]